MATIRPDNQRSFIYLGLAGETGRGRTVESGLYRLADGSDEWETLRNGLPDAPAVRALKVHPLNPDIVYAGTQSGPYRSADRGEHWEKVEIADHGLPVWSFLFHPSDPDVIFVGYENCEIYRSDDAVDMHGVLVSRWWPGTVIGIGRAGMFHSADGGDHWRHVKLEALNAKGQIYCRKIREVPGNPRKIFVTAGANFQSDKGVLLYSHDGGDTWARAEGISAPHTLFTLALEERRPEMMACATNGGEVYSSRDGGENWVAHRPPPAGTQIYALARG